MRKTKWQIEKRGQQLWEGKQHYKKKKRKEKITDAKRDFK